MNDLKKQRPQVTIEMDGTCAGLYCPNCGVFAYIDDGETLDSVNATRDAHTCNKAGA